MGPLTAHAVGRGPASGCLPLCPTADGGRGQSEVQSILPSAGLPGWKDTLSPAPRRLENSGSLLPPELVLVWDSPQ